jgi:hypothetical protein
MKATMNAREDHVLSWSTYGAGNLSGISADAGERSSVGSGRSESSRARRQREIEQGVVARSQGARFHGKFMGQGEPETPLSAQYTESWVGRESWAMR